MLSHSGNGHDGDGTLCEVLMKKNTWEEATWYPVASLPSRRYFLAAGTLDNVVFAFGKNIFLVKVQKKNII